MIPQTASAELADDANSANSVCGIVPRKASPSVLNHCDLPHFTLSWSHYLLLLRIDDPVERDFYEREAARRNWTFRQLEEKRRYERERLLK